MTLIGLPFLFLLIAVAVTLVAATMLLWNRWPGWWALPLVFAITVTGSVLVVNLQLRLMEVDSPTMLLLDEPTDNLDVASADALQEAVDRYEGTVIAVTHDRWLMRTLDRFLFFDLDGTVRELLESPYEDVAPVG